MMRDNGCRMMLVLMMRDNGCRMMRVLMIKLTPVQLYGQ